MTILTEQEIRPVQFKVNQQIAALTDLGRLLSKCSEFVKIDCPACGFNNYSLKFKKNGITYVDCNECQTFFVNPRPNSHILEWFYQQSANYAYWNEVIFPASESTRLERIFVPRVDRLLELCGKYEVETNTILEIGAGFGTFCAEVKKRNVFRRVVAVEPTPDLAKTCRKRDIEILEMPVEQVQLAVDELFDVVASFEVIEHLFSPVDFVLHMKRLLKPGGLFLLTCPNGKGFDIETLGTASDTVDHEHLNYFNQKSLAGLLTHCGLEILECFTPGKLDADIVRNKILTGEFDVSKQPFLKKVLIDDWNTLGSPFQEFLVQQCLSSNMWMVAKKSIPPNVLVE